MPERAVTAPEGADVVPKNRKRAEQEVSSIPGIFSGHPRGFGFVSAQEWEGDVFIPADRTRGAMHGDTVLISILKEGDRRSGSGKKAEGEVIRVLERANKTVVGLYRKSKNFGFVIPDNPKLAQDIFIPAGKDNGAVTGHKVTVRITDFGGKGRNPEGAVTRILGRAGDPGVDILSVIKAYGLPEDFDARVMARAEGIPDRVLPGETGGRLDLRNLPTVTIDGEDARDLDDAVTISKESEDHYTLGVHIADVSHYVTENSPLDREALRRGTSVYLPDRVIPMLPPRLSNGICSLNAGEDRLALSCIMELDGRGDITGHRIAETVIRVDRRMTYTAVNAIVTDREPAIMEEYADFADMFFLMKELADKIRVRRGRRGSIDFDFPESRIILDENGRVADISPYERNAATRIIEDFMLIANETVAEDYFWQELPFIYRSHDYPDPEKMKKLGTFINNFGYSIRFKNGEVHPGEIRKLIAGIEGTPEEALISRMALRSMKRARYTTVCTGHYGLAANYYTHFTSPIRRYPDLQIHRIIKENLRRGLDQGRIAHYERILPEVAASCSELERRADEAERETEKLKKCEYMSRRIGQIYDGVISGVSGSGIYVELPNTVEGMVRVSDMEEDYFIFDEEHMEMAGETTGIRYRLGQKVTVRVAGADKLARTVDFVLMPGGENYGKRIRQADSQQ